MLWPLLALVKIMIVFLGLYLFEENTEYRKLKGFLERQRDGFLNG